MTMRTDHNEVPPELADALEEDPARAARLRSVWAALGSVRPEEAVSPDTERAWSALEARIGRVPVAVSRRAGDRPARPAARRRRGVLVGGGVLVLLLATAAWLWRPVVVSVPAGVQQVVHLPDGSTVELNSVSELRYQRGFGILPFMESSVRRVVLRGEAFFTVAPDAARPFIVETADARVEVLGTRFNVRARGQTLVTLQEGRIRVAPEEGADGVVVDSVGAAVVVRPGGTPEAVRRPAMLDHVLAWRSNGFAAIDEPVGDILQEIQRRYSVRLELEDGLAVDSAMTVFYLRGTSPEEIIHDLCLSRGWKYRETSRGFYVFAAPGGTAAGDAGSR